MMLPPELDGCQPLWLPMQVQAPHSKSEILKEVLAATHRWYLDLDLETADLRPGRSAYLQQDQV